MNLYYLSCYSDLDYTTAKSNIESWILQSWVRVTTRGVKGTPSARRDHAAILLGTEQNPNLFVTGGIDRNWHALGDAWILNLKKEAGKVIQGYWLKVMKVSCLHKNTLMVNVTRHYIQGLSGDYFCIFSLYCSCPFDQINMLVICVTVLTPGLEFVVSVITFCR